MPTDHDVLKDRIRLARARRRIGIKAQQAQFGTDAAALTVAEMRPWLVPREIS